MTVTDRPDLDLPQRPPPARPWVKAILALLCLMMAAMWGYYFFFATDEGVYQLQDKSWRVAAEPICADATAQREALTDESDGYIANPTQEQMNQRADIVDQATLILEQMLDDLMTIPVDNEDDQVRLDFFEENYRIIFEDRRAYTAELRAGNLGPYRESVVGGGPVSNVVLDFTAGVKGNDVPLCSPPGELGGDVQT